MIFFREEAILARRVSQFGNELPNIDRDVLRSSTEVAISTSFIQRIVSEE